MKPMHYVSVIFGLAVMAFLALTTEVLPVPEAKPCTQTWFLYLDDHYIKTIGEDDDVDGGPDLGDGIWFRWFEGYARISVPPQFLAQERCQLIQKTLQERIYIFNPPLNWLVILKAH